MNTFLNFLPDIGGWVAGKMKEHPKATLGLGAGWLGANSPEWWTKGQALVDALLAFFR